jgi:hypothetical protein
MINKSNPDEWVRGRFYREGMVFTGPVQVKSDLLYRMVQLGKQRGTSVFDIADELLRRALDEKTMNTDSETKAPTVV